MALRKYSFTVADAVREGILLRFGICGSSGSGKTKTALAIASRMVERMGIGPVFMIDSETRAGLHYAWSPKSKDGYRFKHCPMPEDDYSPACYMAAIDACEAQGAGVIVIDGLTQCWTGINGVLEQVDNLTDASKSKNAFNIGWKAMTPEHNRLIQKILSAGAHVIATIRAHEHYDLQENSFGKKEPVKTGLAPVQRSGASFEFDVFGFMDNPAHTLTIDKSRIGTVPVGEKIPCPDVAFADVLIDYLQDAEPPNEARTFGEAVNMAVAEGIIAAEEKSSDRYKEAKNKLVEWSARRGVKQDRLDTGLQQFKERVKAVVGPKAAQPSADTAGPLTPRAQTDAGADAKRLATIDAGAA